MERFGISEPSYKLIINLFDQYKQVKRALIFGSRSMGNAKTGSDIDLALIGENIPLLDIKAKLEEALPIPYHFDLVDYTKLKEHALLSHIDRFGKEFYTKRTKP